MFVTKLSKSTERREVTKDPQETEVVQGRIRWLYWYLDRSDKLAFEEENLSKKQECSELMSNLEGTALSCVMAKRTNERDSARKIFDILLNPFGSGVKGH